MTLDYANILAEYMKRQKVTNLASIQELLPGRSRISIFRDLEKLDYLSSYNNAGGYYTLHSIPKFDENGIWIYRESRFSEYGSLKNTVKAMIENSFDGKTHNELRYVLGIRVQNTLHDLVRNTLVVREKCYGAYVYFHIENEIRRLQMDRRNGAAALEADPFITIEVLLAVIRHPELSIAGIQKILVQKRLKIGLNQVEAVFRTYDLGKKNSL